MATKKPLTPKLLEKASLPVGHNETFDWVLYGMIKDAEATLINDCYKRGATSPEELHAAFETQITIQTRCLQGLQILWLGILKLKYIAKYLASLHQNYQGGKGCVMK